jgi:hypothetical protein
VKLLHYLALTINTSTGNTSVPHQSEPASSIAVVAVSNADGAQPLTLEPNNSYNTNTPNTDDSTEGVSKKRQHFSNFFGYNKLVEKHQEQATVSESPESQLTKYLEMMNRADFDPYQQPAAYTLPQFKGIWHVLSRLWCVPATSAPVERIFSQSGIIMRPHRARMSDDLLEMLMFLKCNK